MHRPTLLCIALGLLPCLAQAADPGPDQRRQAAIATAEQQPACQAIQPFYWEIGDKHGALVAASEGNDAPQADTVMPIASASKWVFGSYVVQRRQGKLTDDDIKALTMRAGYTSLGPASCVRLLPARRAAETVQQCFTERGNDQYTAAHDGRFYYNGGHFQALASNALGLGNDNDAQLAADMNALLGQDFVFSFGSPQLAGGIQTSAANYALFLRKLLNQQLLMGSLLGSHAVCTNPATCPSADHSPVPASESWHYSLAHWVEDDPTTGDGAFSSPGAFGSYYQSVQCGRLIRKAWLSGVAQ